VTRGAAAGSDDAEATPKPAPEPKQAPPPAAVRLTRMALQRYRLVCSPDNEPFAIPKSGPLVVRQLRGGRGSLRAELARDYFTATGQVAGQQPLADAINVLHGTAQQADPEPLHLRVAEHAGQLLLDLGDTTGRAVAIGPGGWHLVQRPPVWFRRTALTGALPEPVRGGTLGDLWSLLNLDETHRPILAAVLVAALLPGIPHPILSLAGEQGSGKSTAARMISAALDPSPAQLRKAPRDVETWTTAAAGSWVVALDNISTVPEWLSDALCRASTGDGDVRRELYTNGDLYVIAFRRVVLLNGIDLGALRDDLADRLVTVHLDRIGDRARRHDAEVTRQWTEAHPRVLGALLDLTARVLDALPTVHRDEWPRMADFARVLAAVDQVLGTTGLDTYLALRTELAEDAVTSDPILTRLIAAVTTEWTGTSAELLDTITPVSPEWKPPKDWPSPRQLTTIVRRRAPSLRRLGWTVEELEKDATARAVRFKLCPPPPDLRWPGNDARDARVARPGHVPAGQDASPGSSDSRATAERPSDVTRPSLDARDVTRPATPPLSSTNGVESSDTSDTSDESGPSQVGRRCTDCGKPLPAHAGPGVLVHVECWQARTPNSTPSSQQPAGGTNP